MSNKGYVYCLSNPALESMYKVGYTTNSMENRLKQLSNTSTPYPFKIEFAKMVANCYEKEKMLHNLLSSDGGRVNERREFFKVPLQMIKHLFDSIDGEWYNNETDTNLIDNTDNNIDKYVDEKTML